MAQAGRVTVTEPFKASWLPRLTANIQGGWEEARRAGPWPGVAAPRQRQWGSEARFLFRRSRSEAAAAAATGNDRDSSAPQSRGRPCRCCPARSGVSGVAATVTGVRHIWKARDEL